jgi:hypothetical protein
MAIPLRLDTLTRPHCKNSSELHMQKPSCVTFDCSCLRLLHVHLMRERKLRSRKPILFTSTTTSHPEHRLLTVFIVGLYSRCRQ